MGRVKLTKQCKIFVLKKQTTDEHNTDIDKERNEAAEKIKKSFEAKYLGYKLSKAEAHANVSCGKFTHLQWLIYVVKLWTSPRSNFLHIHAVFGNVW